MHTAADVTTELHSAVQQLNTALPQRACVYISLFIINTVSFVRSGTKQNNRAKTPITYIDSSVYSTVCCPVSLQFNQKMSSSGSPPPLQLHSYASLYTAAHQGGSYCPVEFISAHSAYGRLCVFVRCYTIKHILGLSHSLHGNYRQEVQI